MRLEDIKHKSTLKSIEKYNIDISTFDDIETLRKHIHSTKCKIHRQNNKEYYNTYMLNLYYKKKDLQNLPLCI